MLETFFYGVLASTSMIIDGLVGIWFPLGKRTLGMIMAFSAGVLISAVSYEMILEAVRLAYGTGAMAMGIFAGALTFYFADMLIGNIGSSDRRLISLKTGGACRAGNHTQ